MNDKQNKEISAVTQVLVAVTFLYIAACFLLGNFLIITWAITGENPCRKH